jgi:hypothetical protein
MAARKASDTDFMSLILCKISHFVYETSNARRRVG